MGIKSAATYAEPGKGNFDLVMAIFVALFVLGNIGATKLIEFGGEFKIGTIQVLPIVTDGGAILFPLAYVAGDVLAEVFGMRRARRAILTGFAVGVLASVTFVLIDLAPAASGWEHSEAWHSILGFVPRVVAASLVGYLVGQLLNAKLLTWIKDRGKAEKNLWFRLVSSTVVGELADTALFCTIAFVGIVTPSQLLNYIVFGYLYKVGVEVALVPLTARIISLVKRNEPGYKLATEERLAE